MKTGPRILLSLYFGYVMYSLLMLVYGQSGVLAMRNLESYKMKLQYNLEEIRDANTSLLNEIDFLRSESEYIRLEARKIGFFDAAEGIIHIEGYEQRKDHYTVGRIMRWEIPETQKKPLFRTISLAAALLVFLFSTLFRRKRLDSAALRFFGEKASET